MKKGLLALLLAVALVAPVFAADEGAMELDVKAGFNLMSTADFEYHYGTWDTDVDPAFTAGVDFFYYVMPQLAIGAGIQYVFNSKMDKSKEVKIGWTNLYAQAKYVFETGNDIFNNIYPLVQIGYGILRVDPEEWIDVDSNGLYWGIGIGTTIKENFLVELLYSNNNAAMKEKGASYAPDVKYKTVQLKFGYKFTF